jgi:hypothetical protein
LHTWWMACFSSLLVPAGLCPCCCICECLFGFDPRRCLRHLYPTRGRGTGREKSRGGEREGERYREKKRERERGKGERGGRKGERKGEREGEREMKEREGGGGKTSCVALFVCYRV